MARFVIQTDEKKKRRNRLFMYLFVAIALLNLVRALFFPDDHKDGFVLFRPLLSAVFFGWLAIDSFRNMVRLRFAEISEKYIGWSLHERSNERYLIEWSDIRWVKQEKDGSISIFQDSSFNRNLSLKDLTEENRNTFLHLLEQYATEKNIRMINFSESALAPA